MSTPAQHEQASDDVQIKYTEPFAPQSVEEFFGSLGAAKSVLRQISSQMDSITSATQLEAVLKSELASCGVTEVRISPALFDQLQLILTSQDRIDDQMGAVHEKAASSLTYEEKQAKMNWY